MIPTWRQITSQRKRIARQIKWYAGVIPQQLHSFFVIDFRFFTSKMLGALNIFGPTSPEKPASTSPDTPVTNERVVDLKTLIFFGEKLN